MRNERRPQSMAARDRSAVRQETGGHYRQEGHAGGSESG